MKDPVEESGGQSSPAEPQRHIMAAMGDSDKDPRTLCPILGLDNRVAGAPCHGHCLSPSAVTS